MLNDPSCTITMSRARIITLVLLVLFAAGPASAADERRLQLFVAGSNAFDLTTTLVLRNQSTVVEANPLMQRAVPMKASATALEMYLVHRLWHSGQRRAATFAAVGLLAGNCLVGTNNIRVTR
jgi:hypothetical protein